VEFNSILGHPALQNNDVKGSIGIMTVKKTKDSIELCFSHNTDSFVGFYCIHDERPADIGLIAGLGFYVK
jgi:taspase (threonine aspartase 1)